MPVPYPKPTKERHLALLKELLSHTQLTDFKIQINSKPNGESYVESKPATLGHQFTDFELVKDVVTAALSSPAAETMVPPQGTANIRAFLEDMHPIRVSGGFPFSFSVCSDGTISVYCCGDRITFKDLALSERIHNTCVNTIVEKIAELEQQT